METKNNERKFNVIDVIVIVLIIALIAALVWYFFLRKNTTVDEQTNVEYTIIIKNVNSDYTNIFNINDELKNSSSGNTIGTIKSIDIKPYQTVLDSYTIDKNGNKVANIGEYEANNDIYLTISSKAFVSSQGIYLIDGNKLLIGNTFYIKDGNFAQAAYVVSFKVV